MLDLFAVLRRPAQFPLIKTTIAALAAVFSVVHPLGADTGEPLYYTYHGRPKTLTLDARHIAVHVRGSNCASALPASLANRGFTASDIEDRPLPDWLLLRAPDVTMRPRTNAQPGSTTAARTEASTVHALIQSIHASTDSDVDFISPVFTDAAGHPVVLTRRLLIGFDKDFSANERAQLQASVAEGAATEQVNFPQPHDLRWQIQSADGFAVLARANALAQTPGVKYAEPDIIATGKQHLVPSDPSFSQSWGLRNTGQSNGLFGFDLNATNAWNITVGDPSVIVLILDCGIQQDHPDINQVTGKDFSSDAFSNPNGGPFGPNDNHGTLVAGCVSEGINNGLGTTGLAPGARVAAARVETNGKSNGTFTFEFSWVVDALNWGQSIGARVSNNSNGYDMPSSAIESAYATTRANGMVHFASSGNDSSSIIGYPASINGVNAVGSVNRFGTESQFSNYGPGLKFLAPGEQILTTDRTGQSGDGNGDYITVSGTSFSSPYAAAVAALLISQNPTWTAAQVESQMQGTCRDMGAPGYDTIFGYGLLDAFRALSGPAPTPTPTPSPTPIGNPPFDVNDILVSIGSSLTGSQLAPEQNSVREFARWEFGSDYLF